jgi:predicted Zn finger-like uncharacterized protein
MSLVTTCPHCRTSFKLPPEHLKADEGQVRCGFCKQAFSALEDLRYIKTSEFREAADGSVVIDDMQHVLFVDDQDMLGNADAEQIGAERDGQADEFERSRAVELEFENDYEPLDDPELDYAVEQFNNHKPSTAATLEHLPISLLNRTPLTNSQRKLRGIESLRPDEDAVDFLSGSRSSQSTFARAMHHIAGPFALLLIIALVLQAALHWRNVIVAQWPATRTTMQAFAEPFNLAISAPRSLKDLSIEGFELLPGAQAETVILNVLLRNRTDQPVLWPAMELALTDDNADLTARRIFTPTEYLSQNLLRAADAETNPALGIAGGSEHFIRLALRAEGLKLINYKMTLLYP